MLHGPLVNPNLLVWHKSTTCMCTGPARGCSGAAEGAPGAAAVPTQPVSSLDELPEW